MSNEKYYEQTIAKPKHDNEDFLTRRYSQIAENRTVQRRGSEYQYMDRRNRALKHQQKHHTEQDATILNAMHEEQLNADGWSHGKKKNVGTRSAHKIAMTKQKQSSKTKLPKIPKSNKNTNIEQHQHLSNATTKATGTVEYITPNATPISNNNNNNNNSLGSSALSGTAQ
eukprot:331036_1